MEVSTQAPVGAVFISDIVPTSTGTVASKVYQDTIVLLSCSSSTSNVTVSIIALTGSTHLIPRVTVNGISVSNFTLNAQMRWAGSVVLTGASSSIVAIHEDGSMWTTTMSMVSGPVLTAFNLSGGYPGSQTELKSGDTFHITFTPNMSIVSGQISNFEASQAQLFAASGTGPFTIPITIANRGAGTFSNQRVQLACLGLNNIWGSSINSDVFGVGDGSAYVQLNNDVPSISAISQSNIIYPSGQAALKNSETATVSGVITCSGAFTAAYTSPNNDLSITSASSYAAVKTVQRIAGSYNIGTSNYKIMATKTSNASTASGTVVVYIANTTPTISITQPYTRLQSSISGLSYTITLTANQNLLSAPSLSNLISGQGTWQGAGFTGSNAIWTRNILVADSDSKGTFGYSGLLATNLAGLVASTITSGSSYILGGFNYRVLSVLPWTNRETSIGTVVSDTSKLQVTNLGKYSAGTWNDVYENILTDHNNGNPTLNDYFTITGPSGVLNPSGSILRINDLPSAQSNTTGLLSFEIQENA